MTAFNRLLSTSLWERPVTLQGRWLFALLALAPALLLSWEAGRSTAAMTLAASGDRHSLQRAVMLDPWNPALEEQFGMNYLNSPGATDAAESLRHLRRAVQLGPQRAPLWVDMASACESLNDRDCANRAFERALRLAPKTPRLYWLAANYRLRQSQPESALPLFRRLVALDSSYAQPTFSLCLRVLDDPQLIEHALVPAGKNAALSLAYAALLDAQGHPDAARQAWADGVRQGSRFSFTLAEPYIEGLINSNRLDQAASAWSDLERLGVVSAADGGNLAYNGGFEQPPLNAGFDWRYGDVPYVEADFADTAAFEGRRCLRLDYTGTNADFEPVFQWVPVSPSLHYSLSAEMKSEGITSDSGPRLRVLDADCPACLDVASDMAVGTAPWHQVSIEFTTGPQARRLKVSVWRPHSRSFPTDITGHFWLDAVRLSAEPAGTSVSPIK